MAELRRSLSMVLEQNAIPLPLEERKYGIRVAQIADKSLLTTSSFVLVVSAETRVFRWAGKDPPAQPKSRLETRSAVDARGRATPSSRSTGSP